ncbi:MAG: FAD-dependent monooxygenase [Gluconacetobacter sp.]
MTLAVDLARRGVAFRLIDQLAEPFAGSRGMGIQPRNQEVFEDLGIIDRLAAAGGPYPAQRVYRGDGTRDDVQEITIASATVDEPYRAPLMVPQFRTEAILRDRLAAFGHRPDYGTRLTSFADDGAGVMAHVAGEDGAEVIRCRYLVGADGGGRLLPISCWRAWIGPCGTGSTMAT